MEIAYSEESPMKRRFSVFNGNPKTIKLYIIRPEKYMFKTKIINAADYFSIKMWKYYFKAEKICLYQ